MAFYRVNSGGTAGNLLNIEFNAIFFNSTFDRSFCTAIITESYNKMTLRGGSTGCAIYDGNTSSANTIATVAAYQTISGVDISNYDVVYVLGTTYNNSNVYFTFTE